MSAQRVSIGLASRRSVFDLKIYYRRALIYEQQSSLSSGDPLP